MDGANLMRTIVTAFEKSDLQPLFSPRHWKTASREEGLFRFGGNHAGRPGLLAILAELSQGDGAGGSIEAKKPDGLSL